MYSPEQVAKELGIANSTLRKYAEIFEEAGYQIKRNETNIRRYNDEDIQILKSFINLKQRNSKRTNKEIVRDFFKFENNSPKQKQQIVDVNKLLINYIQEIQVSIEKYDEAIKLINLRLNDLVNLQKHLLERSSEPTRSSAFEEKLDKILEKLDNPKKSKFFSF